MPVPTGEQLKAARTAAGLSQAQAAELMGYPLQTGSRGGVQSRTWQALESMSDERNMQGPVFANIVLADEINRTPPKTQAALLESMQEKQVTIGGQRRPLPAPFFVLATQNPIEQEGTYTLPEAQQDRFMFKVFVRYPTYDEEYKIAETTTSNIKTEVAEVLSAEEILRLQEMVRRVPVAPHVIHYALRLVRRTRVHEADDVPEFIREWVSWGAGPRGVQYLLLGAKARTVLNGRFCVTTDDIKAVVHPVLRHRVIPNFSADSAGMTPDKIVDQLLKSRGLRADLLPELGRRVEEDHAEVVVIRQGNDVERGDVARVGEVVLRQARPVGEVRVPVQISPVDARAASPHDHGIALAFERPALDQRRRAHSPRLVSSPLGPFEPPR